MSRRSAAAWLRRAMALALILACGCASPRRVAEVEAELARAQDRIARLERRLNRANTALIGISAGYPFQGEQSGQFIRGTVQAIKPNRVPVAVLNVGLRQGVKEGQLFFLFRKPPGLAIGFALEVGADYCLVARSTRDWDIKVGDRATTMISDVLRSWDELEIERLYPGPMMPRPDQ